MASKQGKRRLAEERLDAIRRLARERHVVGVEEIRAALGVSVATVRRDLEALEARGEVRRVHGGAVDAGGRLEEPLFDDKTGIAAREKRRIAEAAAARIAPGDTVYLDGGSTVLELARQLRERNGITVVTNSLRAALELAGQGPRLILVGGELRRLSQTVVGPLTRRVLEDLRIDKAFMGTIGVSFDEGLTTTDPSEAYTKELVLGRSRAVFLLADRAKLGKVSFARAGGLDQVTCLVTNRGVGAAWKRGLRQRRIELVEA